VILVKYPVLRIFRDKKSGITYKVGDDYEVDEQRGVDLQRRGFLGQSSETKQTKRGRGSAKPDVSGDGDGD
jgi:hypothetical protein